MTCEICGSEHGAQFRTTKHKTLCAICDSETPAKVNFREFRFAMWPAEMRAKFGQVNQRIELEFYDDYLTSNDTLAEYIENVRA